jgi:glycosyltransferase involved in cell wall biosynthesis
MSNTGAWVPPEVTVVVSTRNRPEMLRGCLESIAALSTRRPVEAVVVDQSDPERRLGVAEVNTLMRHGPVRVRYFPSATVGASRGRNLGIQAARAAIVAVTDDDCRVHPGWLDAIGDLFGADPELAMVCGRVLPAGAADPEIVSASVHTGERGIPFRPGRDPGDLGSGNNVAFRRALLLAMRGYDEHLGPGTGVPAGEDAELLYRLVRAGVKARYEPAPVVYHVGWRDPEALLDVWREYSLGAAVYLTREMVARRDLSALRVLARRTLRFGVGGWLLYALRGERWGRRMSARRVSGALAGVWAVLRADSRRGVGRRWILEPPGADLSAAPLEEVP